jgi:formylglycine-generating enzyme required for sulfatase activity
VRYYPTDDFLPGGLLENRAYRTSKMVMRRVPASGVEFTMGNITKADLVNGDCKPGDNLPHTAMLTNDYYIGVFEFTQGQYHTLNGYYPYNNYYTGADRDLHPCDRISFRRIREGGLTSTDNGSDDENFFWPGNPYGWSLLGILRTRTGGAVKFDLPTEAQWEFAAKAGETGNESWNDGSYMATANIPGQSKERGENVTKAVGSFNSNALGLYDMHGNVWEFCLDWYGVDITALGGAINISVSDGTKLADGVTVGTHRVKRGGSCHAAALVCRSSLRHCSDNDALHNDFLGLRVVCPARAVK